MSTSLLFLGLLFGSIGMGYCIYGRRQHSFVPFACGVLLMAVPYFIDNVVALVAACVLLTALPFFVRV